MALWLDKFKPLRLKDLDYHKDQANHLKNLISSNDFPHLLVYGPSGVGKKTRIHCILRELYGLGVDKISLKTVEFVTASNRKIDINIINSTYHIEVNPSDVGVHDRVVIQELIKETSAFQQLEKGLQKSFKVIVIHETDRLSLDAQHALRRTMEKYMVGCRLILCAESTSKVIAAIRSRCLPIRVPAPTTSDIERVIMGICLKQGTKMPKTLAERIAKESDGNLRRAILAAEVCYVQQHPFTDQQRIETPEWLQFLRDTVNQIIREQSPKSLLEVRGRFYELLSHCIPPELILRTIVCELEAVCDSQLKVHLFEAASEYDCRMRMGQKAIFHLEAFVAKFMSLYKQSFDDIIMDDIF